MQLQYLESIKKLFSINEKDNDMIKGVIFVYDIKRLKGMDKFKGLQDIKKCSKKLYKIIIANNIDIEKISYNLEQKIILYEHMDFFEIPKKNIKEDSIIISLSENIMNNHRNITFSKISW